MLSAYIMPVQVCCSSGTNVVRAACSQDDRHQGKGHKTAAPLVPNSLKPVAPQEQLELQLPSEPEDAMPICSTVLGPLLKLPTTADL